MANGKGRLGGNAMGPGGTCVCSECGYKETHSRARPCTKCECPKCGSLMVREESKKEVRNDAE
ncbi:hypothetical protein KKH30_00130 [Candidatus Micrarchaeota archaeon]|nr:hypothetical protein [Candidatus Micrarchaeota archaeon]